MIASGADVNVRDKKGLTPLDYAPNDKVEQTLLEFEAVHGEPIILKEDVDFQRRQKVKDEEKKAELEEKRRLEAEAQAKHKAEILRRREERKAETARRNEAKKAAAKAERELKAKRQALIKKKSENQS